MAWKGREEVQPDFDRLESILVNSKLATENNALYQAIKGLIQSTRQFQELTNERLKALENP